MYFRTLTTSLSLIGHLAQAVQVDDGGASIQETLLKLPKEHIHIHDSSSHSHGHPESDSIWTEPVECIPKENSTETFCVYTDSKFANGRGISFFTRPSIADQISSLPAFTKKNVHKNANKFDGVPWEVRTIPGRGKGLFATETLQRGDKILADTPMGVYLSDALEQDYKLDYIYLHTAFLQLPEASQDIFLNAMTREGDPIMERVNINAFAGEFEGAQHFLLYPETAVSSIC